MLIATDGACKRNGKPDCISAGVAWIQTEDGNLLFKSKVETKSTSQRGEIDGLLCAFEYACKNRKPDEDIIIVSDSEYLCNTVGKQWCFTWRMNGWVGGTGETVKNVDLWSQVCAYLDELNSEHETVYIQWTKGHLISYTPSNIKQAMREDLTGVTLYERINTLANRASEKDRISNEFIAERVKHDKMTVPKEVALEWAIANVTADALVSFVVDAANTYWLQHQ